MSPFVSEVSEEEVNRAIAAKLRTADFQLKEFKVRSASESSLGFLGDHVRISATVQWKGKDQEIFMFAKKMPSKVQSHYDYAADTRVFFKEIELYKTLLKDITNAVSKNRERKKWLPEFYWSRDWEVLILEDLTIDGYYMLPERTVMDLEHMKVAIESMAVMHAGSIIFEEKLNACKATTLSHKFTKNGEKRIGNLYDHLTFETEASDVKGHPGNTAWESGFRSQVLLVDLLTDYTPHQRNVIKLNLANNLRKAFDFVKPSKTFRNVLLHGDLWANNMMFQKNGNGNVTNCIILDFQLARYGPPAHDILMFLYLVQTREFRRQHESEIFDIYYSALKSELSAEGLEVEKVLPISEFNESINYYREFAIINSIIYFQLIFTPSETVSQYLSSPELFEKNMQDDRSEMVLASFGEDEVCSSRMTEAMRELAEFYGWV